MFSLQAKIRHLKGSSTATIRKQGLIPAVLYGAGLKENLNLEVGEREFESVFEQAGESSLVELEADGKKFEVLIHQLAHDPLTDKIIHIDFFKPSTKKKITAEVPLEFIGAAPAVRDLGGVLVKELQHLEVKGLAHQLPRQIKVDLSKLQTFEDKIVIGDLLLPEGVEITRQKEEMVANVALPKAEKEEEKKEEEKPVEAKVEAAEKMAGSTAEQRPS